MRADSRCWRQSSARAPGPPSSDPIRDARPKFCKEPKSAEATEDRGEQQHRPRVGERCLPQERSTHDVDGREQRVEWQHLHPRAERLGRPEDRRYEEDHLDEARDNWGYVAKARADQTEKNADPESVDGEEDERRQD